MFLSYPGLLLRLESEKRKEVRDESLILDIKTAIHYVEEDRGKILRDLEKLTSQKQITFEVTWALFKPNTLVFNYHTLTQQARLLLVRRVDQCQRKNGTRFLLVTCDMIHDDGNSFGLARESFEIDQFRGAIPISDLTVYPLEFKADKDDVLAQAVQSGKLFAQMDPHSFHEISGQAMREVELADGKFEYDREEDDKLKRRKETFYVGQIFLRSAVLN